MLLEADALADFRRPVHIASNLAVLLDFRQIYYQGNVLLHDHAPEVLARLRQGTLSSNERLIVRSHRRVNIVRIDVRVRDVGTALHETHSRVLVRLEVRVAVHIVAEGLLVRQMLIRFSQLANEAELVGQIAD